jgi:hypothetical protein
MEGKKNANSILARKSEVDKLEALSVDGKKCGFYK